MGNRSGGSTLQNAIAKVQIILALSYSVLFAVSHPAPSDIRESGSSSITVFV